MSEKEIVQQKNRQPNFFWVKINLSICPNTYEFCSDFFLVFDIFF